MASNEKGVFRNVFKIRLSKWRSWLNVLLGLLGKTPLQVSYYRSSEMEKQVCSLKDNYDVVIAHLIRTADYIFEFNAFKIVEMTDAISLNYSRSVRINRVSFKGLLYRIDLPRVKKFEESTIKKADLSVFVSKIDLEYIDRCSNGKLCVATNGIELSRNGVSDSNEGWVIAFIGNLTSLQNLDACISFCEEIMPILVRSGPFTFRIIGRMGLKEMRRLKRYGFVELRPNVDRVADHIEHCFCGVAPIRIGAGIQNKVLEYMALGLPAVVSRVAYEGLEAIPGKQILIARDIKDWVDNIVELKGSRQLRNQLATEAYFYVKNNHNWDKCLEVYLAEIRRKLKQDAKN